jgi:hypothetical protein
MQLYSASGYSELPRDAFVRETLGDELRHLPLPRCKQAVDRSCLSLSLQLSFDQAFREEAATDLNGAQTLN